MQRAQSSNAQNRWLAKAIMPCALALAASSASAPATQAPAYVAEMNESMMKMHAAMDVPPSGNVDRDFATLMIPHHQAAIEMAQTELRYGHDERLRRIAQEIIVDQQSEITVMQMALEPKR